MDQSRVFEELLQMKVHSVLCMYNVGMYFSYVEQASREFKNISFGNRFSIFILDNCCPRYNVIFVWFSGGYAGTKIIYREVTSTYSATEML